MDFNDRGPSNDGNNDLDLTGTAEGHVEYTQESPIGSEAGRGPMLLDNYADSMVDLEASAAWEVNMAGLVPAPLLVIPVAVGEQVVEALIDSGASMSLVDESLVASLEGWREDSKLPPIKGLGACVIQPLATVDVIVHIAGIQLPCSCYVIPKGILEHPLILGCNFF